MFVSLAAGRFPARSARQYLDGMDGGKAHVKPVLPVLPDEAISHPNMMPYLVSVQCLCAARFHRTGSVKSGCVRAVGRRPMALN